MDGYQIRVNDRQVLTRLLTSFGFRDIPNVMIIVDKLDKIGFGGVADELINVGEPVNAVTFLGSYWTENKVGAVIPAELKGIWEVLSGEDQKKLIFDPFLVRGMGYYTGAIFEIAGADGGPSLGGGGRYDGMLQKFLGYDIPAVGFSLGFERIVDMVELPETGSNELALVYPNGMKSCELLDLKSKFMEAGYRVRLERQGSKIQSQLGRIQAEGATKFAIVKPGDEVDGIVVKELKN